MLLATVQPCITARQLPPGHPHRYSAVALHAVGNSLASSTAQPWHGECASSRDWRNRCLERSDYAHSQPQSYAVGSDPHLKLAAGVAVAMHQRQVAPAPWVPPLKSRSLPVL